MFIGRRKSTIESEESSENEVISFRRKVVNTISPSSDSDIVDAYASDDLEDMLEEAAINEEEELNAVDNSLDSILWEEFAGRQQSFLFTGKNGLPVDLPSDISASEVLSLFLDEQVISLLVAETNRYAEQNLHQREMSPIMLDRTDGNPLLPTKLYNLSN